MTKPRVTQGLVLELVQLLQLLVILVRKWLDGEVVVLKLMLLKRRLGSGLLILKPLWLWLGGCK